MRYTALGARGPRVSRLGFGCMRLPMTEAGKVDRERALPMLRRAVDLGVTYFDTAVFYCNGDSQAAVGEALEGVRDRVVLSTKNHLHAATESEWWERLEESLRLLRTDHLDIYNFHGLRWAAYEKDIRGPGGKLAAMRRAKAQGLVRHVCCSFHDDAEALVKLAGTGEFDVITVQYNLLYRDLEDAIARVAEQGVGIVVMGPVGGGRLGVDSERIRAATGCPGASTPEAALRFVLAHPGVAVALSGMSTMEQLEENVRIVSEKEPFRREQIASMEAELRRAKEREGVPCTTCGYCVPCPYGVDIPRVFDVYNEYRMFGLAESARRAYRGLAAGPSACARCGACLPRCPQRIDIPRELNRAAGVLGVDGAGGVSARLALRGADADGLKAELLVHNLGDTPVPCGARVEIDGGEAVPPAAAAADLGALDTRVLRGWRLRVPAGASRVAGRCVLDTPGGEARGLSFEQPFLVAARDAWREHVFVPDGEQAAAAGAANPGFAVGLRWEGERLRVRVRLPSRGTTPAAGGEPVKGDRLAAGIDLRPWRRRTKDWEDGTERFDFALDRAAWWCRSGKAYELDLDWAPDGDGCTLTFAWRFGDFIPDPSPPPRRLGMDWTLVTTDAAGRDAARFTYGGGPDAQRHPLLLAPVFLA